MSRDAALAAYTVAMSATPKILSDELLPYLPEFLDQISVSDVGETLLATANKLFIVGHNSGALDDAKRYAMEALSAARELPNPAVIARASLLLTRIAERLERDDEDMVRLYEEASQAAYDSASQELVGLARGETGLYLWGRLVRTWERDPKSFDSARVVQEVWRCVRPLAEAYRVHVAQRDYEALKIIAGNLGDALDLLDAHRARGLRAHCAVLYASLKTNDIDAQRQAEERARDAASQLFPELAVAAVEGEELARVLLTRLDAAPDSQI